MDTFDDRGNLRNPQGDPPKERLYDKQRDILEARAEFVKRYKKRRPNSGEPDLDPVLKHHLRLYEWLVVSGARAQYKGSGTINGTGNYGFLLTVNDGQVSGGGGTDKFRIKIWDKTTGDVVYDNQLGASDDDPPNTALGGGSIVIHSK